MQKQKASYNTRNTNVIHSMTATPPKKGGKVITEIQAEQRSFQHSTMSSSQKLKTKLAKQRPNTEPANRLSPLAKEFHSDRIDGDNSSDLNSLDNSPVKQKAKWGDEEQASLSEDYPNSDEADRDIDYVESLKALPTSEKSASEAFIKESLLLLRKSFLQDIAHMMSPTNKQLAEVTNKVTHIESKMAEYCTAQNSIADQVNDHSEEISQLKMKIADLEDRSRRNNLKFRGIPENVSNNNLTHFIQEFIKTLLPLCSERDIEIDRAHRLPRPKSVDPALPRDVIARIHFFNTKEKLLREMRKKKKK